MCHRSVTREPRQCCCAQGGRGASSSLLSTLPKGSGPLTVPTGQITGVFQLVFSTWKSVYGFFMITALKLISTECTSSGPCAWEARGPPCRCSLSQHQSRGAVGLGRHHQDWADADGAGFGLCFRTAAPGPSMRKWHGQLEGTWPSGSTWLPASCLRVSYDM